MLPGELGGLRLSGECRSSVLAGGGIVPPPFFREVCHGGLGMSGSRIDRVVDPVRGRLSADAAVYRHARRGGVGGRAAAALRPFLVGLLLALLCAPVMAQTVPPTDWVTAKSVNPIGPSGGTYLGQGNFIANGKYIPAGYYKAPIAYNPATIGKLVGKVLGHTIRLAVAYETIKDLYDLANYLYDPATGQTSQGGSPAMSCSSGYEVSSAFYQGLKFCGAPALNAVTEPYFQSSCYNNYVRYGGGSCSMCSMETGIGTHYCEAHWRTSDTRYSPDNDVSFSYSVNLWGSPVTDAPIAGTAVPDSDVYNLVKDDPSIMRGLLHDPEGNIIRTPEVKAAEDTLGQALKDKYGVPDAVGDGGDATGLDSTTDTPTAVVGTTPDTMPEFCGWASYVCDFIDWMKVPPTTDTDIALPEKDPGIVAQHWESGQGAGSCPAPVTVDLSFMDQAAPLEFSYQPLCDLASLLNGLTIAASLLIAAYIISGTRNV